MKRLIKISFLLIGLLYLGSCEDFLEVPTAKDQIDIDKVFNDDKMATSALMQVYTDLRNNGFLCGSRAGVGYLLACYTDELEVTTTQMPDFRVFYLGNVNATTSGVGLLWKNTYKQIYMLNNIIEGVDKSEVITTQTKKQLKGEAIALRGILHFYLTQTFAEIPYVFTTDFRWNTTIGKQSVSQVMQYAIDDLLTAEQLLNEENTSFEKVRINKYAVKGFLARMYLYVENWNEAQKYALEVITDSGASLSALDQVFLKESSSTLWQLKPDAEGKNTYEAEAHIFISEPAPQSKLQNVLIASFEPNDLRKELWIKTVGSGNSAHAFKYKQRGATASSLEYSKIIRLEEMYLITAEAAAHNNDWDLCNSVLNTLRSRAGLTELEILDKTPALSVIKQERRIELFCEFGHRFYDLKRYELLSELTLVKPNWQNYFQNLPIPEAELLLNPNLKPQNNGY